MPNRRYTVAYLPESLKKRSRSVGSPRKGSGLPSPFNSVDVAITVTGGGGGFGVTEVEAEG